MRYVRPHGKVLVRSVCPHGKVLVRSVCPHGKVLVSHKLEDIVLASFVRPQRKVIVISALIRHFNVFFYFYNGFLICIYSHSWIIDTV